MDRRRLLVLVALIGWLSSLALPALSFQFEEGRDQILYGYQILIAGYFHLVVAEFSWLANFTFLLSGALLWFRPDQTRMLFVSGVATALLAAQSIEIFILDDFFGYPRPYPGYYLWVAGNMLMSLVAILAARSGAVVRHR